MRFNLAFCDGVTLSGAAFRNLRATMPHLRLVPLIAAEEYREQFAALPLSVQQIVVSSPSAARLGDLDAVVGDEPALLAVALPDVPPHLLLAWEDVKGMYDAWMRTAYLPLHAHVGVLTPDALDPVGVAPAPVELEIVGSCASVMLADSAADLSRILDQQIVLTLTTQNHPVGAVPEQSGRLFDVQLVVPPFRYMHPATLEDFADGRDLTQVLDEAVEHLRRYLDTAVKRSAARNRFVVGFLEPLADPRGRFSRTGRDDVSDPRTFVRRLNGAVAAWCAERGDTRYIDGDEIAGALGRAGIDDGLLFFLSHRAPFDPYDDNVDALTATRPEFRQLESFRFGTKDFGAAVLREVLWRCRSSQSEHQVKLVVVDLDNTLWRGVAADRQLEAWNGRPKGIVEALRILRRRGIMLAVLSRNDEDFIRGHWSQILGDWASEPLGFDLSLDEFAATHFTFGAKSEGLASIMESLGVLPTNTVFIDDSPIERHDVVTAFPAVRLLGTEMNYVRRELLYSPYTQNPCPTAEDALRAASVRTTVAAHRAQRSGGLGDFLQQLRLEVRVSEVGDVADPRSVRALQLLNKTNQWNLNGDRIAASDWGATLLGSRVFCLAARDTSGDHGVVGVAVINDDHVTHAAVSCRVLALGVDQVLLAVLAERFSGLRVDFRRTESNRAAQEAVMRWTEDSVLAAVSRPAHVRIEEPGLRPSATP